MPGAGLAVKPVAFWVTASRTFCWPRSAMVSAEITSTLAGVCSRVRPSRLPAVLAPVRLSVGAANAGPVVRSNAARRRWQPRCAAGV